jgi:hypothetical protein
MALLRYIPLRSQQESYGSWLILKNKIILMSLLVKFDEFVNEQYTLTIEDSMDDFEVQETEWLLEYNVTDIWSQYSKDKDFKQFITKYRDLLLGKKKELSSISSKCWNDLVKIVKEKPSENKLAYLDNIYDWADEHGVKIITGK